MASTLSVIPVEAVFDRRLGNADIRVLCALGAFADRNGKCWPATTTLAEKLGVSDRRVRECLRNLEARGHLCTEHRPGQRSVYLLVRKAVDPGTSPSGVDPGTSASGVGPNPGTSGSGGAEREVPGTPEREVPPNDSINDTLNDDAARYAFAGEVIRLKKEHLETWRQRYHAIPDLEAELAGLDSWYVGTDAKKGKGWFHRAQRSLNEKHQERLAAKQAQQREEPKFNDGVY